MLDKIDSKGIPDGSINGISEENFNKLNDSQKEMVLLGNNEVVSKDKDSGIIGRLVGANTKNASIHIALVISVILLLFLGMDLVHSFMSEQKWNVEMWDKILPIITLVLGYIFGNKGKEDNE